MDKIRSEYIKETALVRWFRDTVRDQNGLPDAEEGCEACQEYDIEDGAARQG